MIATSQRARSQASVIAIAAIVFAMTAGSAAAPSQAKRSTKSGVRGRLLDESRKPIGNVTLRPCAQMKRSDGSVSTMFAMFTDDTFATARTNGAGKFEFEGELAPRDYCLAAESRGDVRVLKDVTGEMLRIDVSRDGQRDLGDIVVKWP